MTSDSAISVFVYFITTPDNFASLLVVLDVPCWPVLPLWPAVLLLSSFEPLTPDPPEGDCWLPEKSLAGTLRSDMFLGPVVFKREESMIDDDS